MSVAKYTTPTFVLTFNSQKFPELDLTQANNVYVTIKSGVYVLTKTGVDLDVNKNDISVFLSQEETSNLQVGTMEIQANWTLGNGERAASEKCSLEITDNLLKQVVE